MTTPNTQVAGKTALDTQVGGSHYKDMPIQPLTLMCVILTPEEYIGYLKGNIIKYSMRAGHKVGTDDAAKAAHYTQILREHMGEAGRD